jgi:hypothetical protein
MYYAGDMRKIEPGETKGVGRVRQAVDRAREEWTDAERRLRQRMRVYPQKLSNMITRSREDPGLDLERQTVSAIKMGKITPEPKPIVSINGEDVEEKT